jgi:enterochelin esterase-like enzyme
LSHVGGTNFFFASQTFENDARLDYKLVIDDNWILDPRNTHQVSGGYGPNSECAMLDYVQPSEIQVNTESQGTVSSSYFQDETMGLTHTYSVYLPPNYSESETYPVAYFLDGNEYIQLGFAANVLDNLIYENKVQPIIGVFIDPINRNTEYAYDYNYLTMITSEFVPFIDSTYSTQPTAAGRAIIGVSLGGLTSLLFVEQYPEVFGNCGAFSPAVWLGNIRDVYNSAQNLSGKFYLDAGTYEESIYNASIDILTRLQAINADYTWKVWHEGHSWGAWRAHLDEALIYFWPMSTNSVDK